ncbi:hypothetical protein DVR12_07505 [Chitinophaga silvatica]|uniref:Uncharacterized protein n=1 Tax=Chitinophaga silvatica TaxID=2282649 RepID=A0A3E1YEX7_9BACT|nr:hypothetical protein DVR12_07505 [Chitinophaga silvatica]
MAQKNIDSIFTAKGAVTVLNCNNPISTVQLGDGKNQDYDYRILENNIILIRSQGTNPKPTNLVIKAGDLVHYLILSQKESSGLNNLKYTLPAKIEQNRNVAKSSFLYSSVRKEDILRLDSILSLLPAQENVTDTNTISKIATNFGLNLRHRARHRTNYRKLKIGYVKAMTLNGYDYLCLRVKSKDAAIDVQNINLVRKETGYQHGLYNVPIFYHRTIKGKRTAIELVVVTSSHKYHKKDKLIVLLRDIRRTLILGFYLSTKVLPGSMK